jgi:HEAT repeat protein
MRSFGPWAAVLLACGAVPLQAQAPPAFSRPPVIHTSEVAGKTLAQWMADLKHPDPSVREEAIRAVTLFGPEASKAVPLLVDRLRDNDASPRVKACVALSMVEISKADIPAVVRALAQRVQEDTQSIVRYYAAVALIRFGEDAKPAVQALALRVSDGASWEIRHACVVALRRAGRDARGVPHPGVTRALLEALRDPTLQVRFEAVTALGALGQPEDPALLSTVLRAMEDRLHDRDKTVQIWAMVGLMALDKVNDAHVQAIIKFLKDRSQEPRVRIQAARALGTMGKKARGGVEALVSVLDDKEMVVAAACASLAEIGDPGPEALAALAEMLKNPDLALRSHAAYALGQIGPRAKAAAPGLVEMMKTDKEPQGAGMACWALGEVSDAGNAPVVAALTEFSQRKDIEEALRQVARDALEQVRKPKK